MLVLDPGVEVNVANGAFAVAKDCIQILGGIGYTKKYPVERILRDVRASRLTAGSTEMMRLIIQQVAFDRLRDPDFRGELVGRELEGSPVQGPRRETTR